MTFLADSGELENSLVVLTSDHGEAFRERGIEGHARKVYRETTHVPFMIFFPFHLDPGVEIEVPTSGVDVWPTVLDLLGLPALSESEGVSRKPEILAALRKNPTVGATSPAYAFLEQRWGQPPSEHLFPTLSIVEGDFRYVYTKGRDGRVRRELFDARGDPGEFRNVILEEEEEASRMEKLTQEYLKRKSIWSEGVETLELDELELNQLRALGYEIP
jgi:arylsulfatase A-like enzyme